MYNVPRSMNPAYWDLFCEKHERKHKEDVCPLCEMEDRWAAEDERLARKGKP